MKVVIINNDLRIFWKGRVTYLKKYLASVDIELYAIELFGKGSPYSFDSYTNNQYWWSCLFPENDSGELAKETIAAALFSKLNSIDPDVIISSSIVFFAGALGIRWAKSNKKKFIMFDDAKPWQVKRNFAVQWVKNLITSQSDAIWLPSEDYDSSYQHFKNRGIDFFYGYNCIDNLLFRRNKTATLNNKVFICVSRLVQIKNTEGLLHAWQLVEASNTEWKLLIVGNGPEYERLNELIRILELKNAKLLGVVANEDTPAYYHSADALILASFSETWGLVINEAMAAGLPVILSNKINAGNTLLSDGLNGFSFDPLNVDQMAGSILKYINANDTYKKEMSDKSLQIISHMSYENMGKQLTGSLIKLKSAKFKKPGLLAGLIINLWYGRYNTVGWDRL